MSRNLRQRIGDRFQYYRERVKGWRSPNMAAVAMHERDGPDSKTIQNVEGEGNPTWSSLETYAKGMGVPLERILREAMQPVNRAEKMLGPEARTLLELFTELADVRDRRRVLDTAELALEAQRRRLSAHPSSTEDDLARPETESGSHERAQKSRRG